MKEIKKFIIEKLHINKDTKIEERPAIKVKDIYLDYPEPRDEIKMKEYKAKGSKPDRLVSSIKDRGKLERRCCVAIKMGWDEAVRAFSNALVDRGYYTREEIDQYLDKKYYKR